MKAVRFEKFTLLIDGIHKSINRIKTATGPDLGVKGVHVFWIYTLSEHPRGLSSAELAAISGVDRSLVSREIAYLGKEGYIVSEKQGGKRGYNSRYTLTEKGRELAAEIYQKALHVQELVGCGISEQELSSFYSTLEKLHENFMAVQPD